MSGKGITAFAGYSGAGKSTTAAIMSLFGYRVVADDILPVTFRPFLRTRGLAVLAPAEAEGALHH